MAAENRQAAAPSTRVADGEVAEASTLLRAERELHGVTNDEATKKQKKKRKDKKKAGASATAAAAASPRQVVYSERQLLSRQSDQVMLAVDMVANSLLNGPWPSPFCNLADPEGEEQQQQQQQQQLAMPHQNGKTPDRFDRHWEHTRHMTIVGTSLKEYARDVILPSFQAERGGGGSLDEQRVFLAVLILLREVMIQNAESIFGTASFDFSDDLAAASQSQPSAHALPICAVTLFSIKVLVTAVIVAGIGATFSPPATSHEHGEDGDEDPDEEDLSGTLTSNFLEMVTSYDRADDQFVQHLLPKRDSDAVRAKHPEFDAYQISLNLQRNRHHLLRASVGRRYESAPDGDDGAPTPLPPAAAQLLPTEGAGATAVHITLLEAPR